MSNIVKLKQGFDIKLKGEAKQQTAENAPLSETFAIKPTDFLGMERPKVIVNPGDAVKAGTPILYDKLNEKVMYTAPVSGEIAEVKRGEKRKLLEIVILADKEVKHEAFKKYTVSEIAKLDAEEAKGQMLASGVWPNLLQRPFGIVANPDEAPKSIFISGFDSHPLAPNYDYLFKGEEHYLQEGINVLAKLTKGKVYLNIDGNDEVSNVFAHVKNVELTKFYGPHPSGNVGVQIHHLDPIVWKEDLVWTINPYGVIQIGKLFMEGIFDASKLVALTGPEVKTPQYYKTYSGACINKFIENNLETDHVRCVSGNALTGTKISKDGYVGFFDHQVTVLKEGDHHEFLGWILPTVEKLSFHRGIGLLSFLMPKKKFALDTNTNGEPRAFVMTGAFEKVLPMDIYPTFLLKAIIAEDYDEMEELGILEVVEEDMALCEFIDVSKHPVQSLIRQGINMVRKG